VTAERHAPLIYVTVRDVSGIKQRVSEQTHRIEKLEYTDSQNKTDKCTLTVDNHDLSNFDDPLWAHGNFVQVSWGYPGQMAIARELIITKVTGFEDLKVEAKAKSILIDAVKKSRTFKNKTRAEIVQEIAGEYGYLPETLLIEETTKRIAHVTQAGLSDAQFIRKLAHQQGFDFYVDHEGFHFHQARHDQPPCRLYTWYRDQGRGDVLKIDVESDITRKPAKVKKKGRDSETKQTEEAVASNKTDPNRPGTGKTVIVAADDLMTASFETREDKPPVELLYTPYDAGPMSTNDKETEAKKKFRDASRSTVKMKIDVVGDPAMLAKTVIQLEGVGKKLSGLYFVKEIKHTVGQGYTMQLTVSSDGVGEVRTLANNGLPVVGNESHAKRSYEHLKGVDTASLLLRKSVGPDALVPVAIKDAKGNNIGTAWRERKPGEVDPKPPGPPRTVIRDGALVTEEKP
jgi:uncharacterized protein